MIYTNVLYEIAAVIQHMGDNPGANLDLAFGEMYEHIIPRQARLRFIKLFDDAQELVAYLDLPDSRKTALSEVLRDGQEKAVFACGAANGGDFFKTIGGKLTMVSFAQMGDTVAGSRITAADGLDRLSLSEATNSLIESVRSSSSIPDYARRVLELKLSALTRILVECSHYSDDEIRRRVKAVYADFCAEFERHDKSVMPLSEKMRGWARSVSKPGVLALALTADLGSVVGLIAKS